MQRNHPTKADQATIRCLNMSSILKLLRQQGTLSRADLAKELGVTRNTVSNIVSDLLDAELVMETKLRREGTGRPGLLLELAPTGGYAIGLEIDISRIIVIAVNFQADVLWETSVTLKPGQSREQILVQAEQLIQSAIDQGKNMHLRPLGIGIGLAGLVDAAGANLIYAPTLGWRELPLKTRWEEKFKLSVWLDNEANTSAVGYYNYADSSSLNMAYLSIGFGMAAGLMLDGKLFRGSGGYAGQAGHMKIRPEGERCSCGDRGCWSTEVGLTAVARLTGQSSVDIARIETALNAGDAKTKSALDQMADVLGIGLVNLINLFNLDLIILGGAMRPLLPHMLEQARNTVNKRALPNPRADVRIKVSDRDDDSVFGAACLVLDAVISNPVKLVRARV
jgi:predicted NBD/HSP70 family sugar kinase